MQAITGMGMMNQLGINTPIRGANSLNYNQQRVNQAIRQQQLQQLALASPQVCGSQCHKFIAIVVIFILLTLCKAFLLYKVVTVVLPNLPKDEYLVINLVGFNRVSQFSFN